MVAFLIKKTMRTGCLMRANRTVESLPYIVERTASSNRRNLGFEFVWSSGKFTNNKLHHCRAQGIGWYTITLKKKPLFYIAFRLTFCHQHPKCQPLRMLSSKNTNQEQPSSSLVASIHFAEKAAAGPENSIGARRPLRN